MDNQPLKPLSTVELADSIRTATQQTTSRLREFREAEYKRLEVLAKPPLSVPPVGWQQWVLVALFGLGGEGDLAAVTKWLERERGEANKSTVLQALTKLLQEKERKFIQKPESGTKYLLTEDGKRVAALIVEVERSAKAFAVGAVLGGRARIEELQGELKEWDRRLADLLSHAEVDKASPARIYDFLIGGNFNFVVDRLAVANFEESMPMAHPSAAAMLNRAFLNEAVSRLTEQGVRQFIDVGAGLPTTLNTHDVVGQHVPARHHNDWRVVYVDSDPSVVEIGGSLLKGNEQVRYVLGQFESLGAMLADDAFKILDQKQPIALVLVAILHFVPDDRVAAGALETISLALPAGSMLVLSHGCRDEEMMSEEVLRSVDELSTAYFQKTKKRVRARSIAEIASLLKKRWKPIKDGEIDFIPNLLKRWGGTNQFLRSIPRPIADQFAATPESSLIVGTVQTLR